jgi:hypothetical protein
MRSTLLSWTRGQGWVSDRGFDEASAALVLYFGDTPAVADGARQRELRARFPAAAVLGCSTGGQIRGDDVLDDGVQAIALSFRDGRARLATRHLAGLDDSQACGTALARELMAPDLRGILLLSEGLDVDAGALLAGMQEVTGPALPILGGLAGDGPRFVETLVGAQDIAPCRGLVAAVGLFGESIRFGHGCGAGWEVFGPLRCVTASDGRTLLELDQEPALRLYERYLGPEAEGLPHTGLLYPLRIWNEHEPQHDMLRTVLGVDHAEGSMTFAGGIPPGWRAQLMRGSFDSLQRGAAEAAAQAGRMLDGTADQDETVAVMVSCVGRRLVMGQHVVGEILEAREALPPGTTTIGFYSYGEIAPHPATGRSELHNQTMTIALISEAAEGH